MDKYIHIEDLKDYLNRQIQAFEPCPNKYDAAVGIYDGLHRIPAADVAPVRHGRWVADKEDVEWGNHLIRYRCSICNKQPHFNKEEYKFILSPYCPNCGARMEGES